MPTTPLQPDAGEPWRLLPFSDAPMGRQLALSEGMLAALGQTGAPALRWYVPREAAVVLGNSQKPAVTNAETLAADHIALYKRPSGGTAVLVDASLLSLDIALPHTHPLATGDVVRAYEWVGALWTEALRGLGVTAARALPVAEARAQPSLAKDDPLRLACYGTLSPWEVVVGEPPRKLVGLCQTRRRFGALYQIGVYLRFDAAALARLLALPSAEQAALAARLAAAASGLDEALAAPPDPLAVIAAVEGALAHRHGAALIRSSWLPAELDYAAQIEGERFQSLI